MQNSVNSVTLVLFSLILFLILCIGRYASIERHIQPVAIISITGTALMIALHAAMILFLRQKGVKASILSIIWVDVCVIIALCVPLLVMIQKGFPW